MQSPPFEELIQSLDLTTLRELLRLAACQATELASNRDDGNRPAALPRHRK